MIGSMTDSMCEFLKKALVKPNSGKPHYIIIGKDTFVEKILPKSGSGITLKAGIYIDGVRQEDEK